MELISYFVTVNKAKMVEQGLNALKGQEAPKSQIHLDKQPITSVLIQAKGKRPIT